MEAEAPALVALARRLLDAHVHKALATLRRDGSPRISGSETIFAEGDLWVGSMGGSVKARDLQRDPRFALHSGSAGPPDWEGDAKVGGRMEEVTDPGRKAAVFATRGDVPPEGSHLFRADVTEVVVVRVADPADHLLIDAWRAGRGLSHWERS